MNKKLLLVVLVLIIGGLAAGYYFYYLPNQESDKQVQIRQPRIVSQEVAISPVSSLDNDAIWYGRLDGRLMRFDLNTGLETEYPVDRPPGSSFSKIIWPKIGSDYISESLVNSERIFNYYNSITGKYLSLPKNIVSLDWLKDGRRILYIWQSNNGSVQLISANADGTGYKKIADVPWSDLVPYASPTGDTALLVRPYVDVEVNKIYLFDLNQGTYTEAVSEGRNTAVLWSPKGDKFAYTSSVANKSLLNIKNLVTNETKATQLPVLINQVYFSADGLYLYAAADKIYKINTETFEQTVFYDPGSPLSVKELLVIGQKIIYTDSVGKLYIVE